MSKKNNKRKPTVGAQLLAKTGLLKTMQAALKELQIRYDNAVSMNEVLRRKLQQYAAGQFCPKCSFLWYNVDLDACPNCQFTDLETGGR